MTERGAGSLTRTATQLAIGPSAWRWDGGTLVIDIDERGTPLPRRVRGQVRVHVNALTHHSEMIDGAGAHRWRPMAPACRVEVALSEPSLGWRGTGYLDSNDGDAPLERDFRRWDWSRAVLADGSAAILYETECRDGGGRNIALRIDGRGQVETFTPPGRVALPASRWRIGRATRAEAGATVTRSLVDAPFYARSVLRTTLFGQSAEAVHESVDLDRFKALSTQAMLAFRVGKARGSASGPVTR